MHDTEEDHFRGAGDPAGLEENHPLWQSDRIELRSVGVDIGSSTSHLIFSTLELRRQSATLSSRFELVRRRVDYASPIILTPFADGALLDVVRLSDFFESAYAEAGISKDKIDTGAVITTGDAARKDNAASVVQLFSEQAGKFVCASAGPLLEAKMAAYGSGAVARSAKDDTDTTVLNMDVGGGTSKLAIVRGGRIVEATAINVGARLITFDRNDRLTKIERAAEIVARHLGIELQIGATIDAYARRDIATALVDALLELAARRPLSTLTRELMIAPPFHYAGEIDIVTFSGGVSEYFYRHGAPLFGDIGSLLARLLRQRLGSALPAVAVEKPVQGIRATVIGASQFTAQVSGNTLYIAKADLLPLRNLQVVVVDLTDTAPTSNDIAAQIRRNMGACECDGERPVAFAARWPHGPAYPKLNALACGLAEATVALREAGLPIILVLDVDLARLTGTLLSQRTGGYPNILCIDGIDLQEFDFIDIGEERADSHVVPVIVKSLAFTG